MNSAVWYRSALAYQDEHDLAAQREPGMKRNIRSIVIAATLIMAGVPMLAGCVVVPAYHGYWHGHDWRR
jgi:hypothetical protein